MKKNCLICDNCGHRAESLDGDLVLVVGDGWSSFRSVKTAADLCPDCTTSVLAVLTERAEKKPPRAIGLPKDIADALDSYGTDCMNSRDHGDSWRRLKDAILARLR